ncbi:FISUMP domain-containing protein [Dysgonomonas sp. Marseille-P4361]|uniref:FISUMP domain-containing protein n=1 Tax=Dysgonomonas sp. Marseille-P4361 TaxID=2161820 RepID=UPI000D54CE0A|nr:FISUMP domain-containing protein [Dysgonomonas sp. Marseille-P4361]
MINLRNLALVIYILLATAIHAQVTIGSGQEPNKGALLDLKEEGDTKRGLGMPRVELTKLRPTTPTELAASIGGTGEWGLDEHTALIVYNTKGNHCATPEIYEGLYVFDGEKWQYLGQKGSVSTKVSYYEDTRDQLLGKQSYPYRSFGNAGIWMTENMRYVPNDNGATMTASAGGSNSSSKYYTYPNAKDNPEIAPDTWDPSQGLLYSYSAATLGEQDEENIDQGQKNINQEQEQVAGDTPGNNEVEITKGKIQGICPTGWHVPSDREWNQLEKEVYKNAHLYSTYTENELRDIAIWKPSSWNPEWERGLNERGSEGQGGHGLAMLGACKFPDPDIQTDSNGKSLSTEQGGINIPLTNDAVGGGVHAGDKACFWTASVQSNDTAWFRGLHNKSKGVYRQAHPRTYLYSVRCKKDKD